MKIRELPIAFLISRADNGAEVKNVFTDTLERLSQGFGAVKQYFSGLQYPVNKQNLVEFARSKGANQTILSLLGQIPDKQYQSEQEVSDEVESAAANPTALTPPPA